MFYLDSGVHLHEIEIPGFVEEKFDRSRSQVFHAFRTFNSRGSHFLAQLGIDGRRRRFFDQFLVTALYGAIPFAEMDDVAV